MADSANAKLAPVSAADDVVIYNPDYSLKTKIGKEVDIRELLRPELLQRADHVVLEYKPNFMESLHADLKTIQALREELEATSWDASLLQQFMQVVMRVKARAGTFGYPLASEIARKLFVFCEEGYRAKADHTLVVRKHVEGLAVVIQRNIEGDGGVIGQELLASLDKLAQKLK